MWDQALVYEITYVEMMRERKRGRGMHTHRDRERDASREGIRESSVEIEKTGEKKNKRRLIKRKRNRHRDPTDLLLENTAQ